MPAISFVLGFQCSPRGNLPIIPVESEKGEANTFYAPFFTSFQRPRLRDNLGRERQPLEGRRLVLQVASLRI